MNSQIFLELHIPEFNPAINFYSLLGFEVKRKEVPPGGYLVLASKYQTLCFYGGTSAVSEQEFFCKFPESTVRGYGVEVVIFTENLEESYKQVSQSEGKVVAEITMRKWGVKDFRATDPFGYYLRVTSPYDVTKQGA